MIGLKRITIHSIEDYDSLWKEISPSALYISDKIIDELKLRIGTKCKNIIRVSIS